MCLKMITLWLWLNYCYYFGTIVSFVCIYVTGNAIQQCCFFLCHLTSLLLRRFVFCMAEASVKRVTGDEPQGTMGRVPAAGLARCLLPAFLCAHIFIKRETSGYEAAQGTKKVVEGSNVYDWPCFLFANAMTVLTVDFEMAFWSARSG